MLRRLLWLVACAVASQAGPPAWPFASCLAPSNQSEPADEGPDLRYGFEWWYFTGHVAVPGTTQRFGIEICIFRAGACLPVPPHSLPITEAYISHMALTDISNGTHIFNQALHPAVGPHKVDASSNPLRLSSPGNFLIEQSSDQFVVHAGWSSGPQLRLQLNDTRGKVDEGRKGWIHTGSGDDDTTYYTSRPNLDLVGTLQLPGAPAADQLPLEGHMWMDRELWKSAEQLPFKGHGGMAGWDWFGINLHDGTAVELSPLRPVSARPGLLDPKSTGSVFLPVDEGGGASRFHADAFSIVATGSWRSNATGVLYPSGWDITVRSAAANLSLHVEPQVQNQEFIGDTDVIGKLIAFKTLYWEGACSVTGTRNGSPVSGNAYVELTGYDEV